MTDISPALPSLRARLIAVGAGLALVVSAAFVALLMNDSLIHDLVRDSQEQTAPRIIERQRAATNLERLIRFGWVSATAADPADWRMAAQAAQALSYHPSLTFDDTLRRESQAVHEMVRQVSDLREQALALRQRAVTASPAEEERLLAQAKAKDAEARALWTPQEATLVRIELALADDAARLTVERFEQIADLSGRTRGWAWAAAAAILLTLALTGLIIHRNLFAPVHRIVLALRRPLDGAGGAVTLPAPATAEIATIQDAALRLKAALEQSADREIRLAAILTASPAGIAVTDTAGHVQQANQAFLDLLGYSGEEFLALNFRDFTHPDDLVREERLLRDLLSGRIGRYRIDKRYRHKDGAWVWVDLSVSAIRDRMGEVQMFVGVAIDISDRVRAEQDLRFVQSLVDKSADPIFCVDPADGGRMVWANAAACRHFGVTSAQLLGMSVLDWNPDLTPASLADLWQRLRSGGGTAALETHHRVAGDQVIPVEVSTAWLIHGGRPYCAVHVRDLRERNRMLEVVRRSNEDLQQFATVASHDLQEPLRMVASFLQLLERRYAGRLDDEAREYIRFAVDGAVRMKRLIEDLLEFSRVDTRGAALVSVDLCAVLAEAVNNLAPAIAESEAEVSLPSGSVRVLGDAGQLVRLFQNLIGNAIKYRSPDRLPRVTVTACRTDRDWEIAVADNGIGIAPEYHERIFLIFQRLHGQGRYEGTGIGLAVCKRIAERHGGSIAVESGDGQGSTFRVGLPAA